MQRLFPALQKRARRLLKGCNSKLFILVYCTASTVQLWGLVSTASPCQYSFNFPFYRFTGSKVSAYVRPTQAHPTGDRACLFGAESPKVCALAVFQPSQMLSAFTNIFPTHHRPFTAPTTTRPFHPRAVSNTTRTSKLSSDYRWDKFTGFNGAEN